MNRPFLAFAFIFVPASAAIDPTSLLGQYEGQAKAGFLGLSRQACKAKVEARSDAQDYLVFTVITNDGINMSTAVAAAQIKASGAGKEVLKLSQRAGEAPPNRAVKLALQDGKLSALGILSGMLDTSSDCRHLSKR